MTQRAPYKWFVKGDLDGFFGLAVDNLVQVLVIVYLCKNLCGFDDALLYHRVLPGVAVSLLIGNLYYALHARRVARRDGNNACTALPYGINTPSVFAYIFFILAPVYQQHLADLTRPGLDAVQTAAASASVAFTTWSAPAAVAASSFAASTSVSLNPFKVPTMDSRTPSTSFSALTRE